MRTPAEHRAAVAAWRETAPANDSQILQHPRTSSPRHSALSADLGALLKWKAMSQPKESPLQTNWRIVPANDNNPESYRDDLQSIAPEPPLIECVHEIRPRPLELVRAVRSVRWIDFRHANTNTNGPIDKRPVGGDVETMSTPSRLYGRLLDRTVRLGDLRLGTLSTTAHGTTTLPGNNRQIVKWRGSRPVDRFGHAKGSGINMEEEAADRQRLASWLGCEPGEHVPTTRDSRRKAREHAVRFKGLPLPPLPSVTAPLNEARAFAGLPPVEEDKRPALPLGSPDVGNIFGSRIIVPKKGKGGAVAADNDNQDDADAVRGKLSAGDVEILDRAVSAHNFGEIGQLFGATGKTAERRGKVALIDATARLTAVLEELAA